MLLLALILADLTGQDAPFAKAEVYAPPVVQPYTPPSSFGLQIAEGDADGAMRRRPIAAAVAVEAYRDNYEARRSTRELTYEQGVDRALIAADARMGPLDGRWRVSDARGDTLLDLELFDTSADRPVQGAWTRTTRRGAREMGTVTSVARDGAAVVIEAAVDGRTLRLRLEATEAGWTGHLGDAPSADHDRPMSRDRSVSMKRPGAVAS